jgi:hypothetical protein
VSDTSGNHRDAFDHHVHICDGASQRPDSPGQFTTPRLFARGGGDTSAPAQDSHACGALQESSASRASSSAPGGVDGVGVVRDEFELVASKEAALEKAAEVHDALLWMTKRRAEKARKDGVPELVRVCLIHPPPAVSRRSCVAVGRL